MSGVVMLPRITSGWEVDRSLRMAMSNSSRLFCSEELYDSRELFKQGDNGVMPPGGKKPYTV